jgi:hypothetical protein
VGRRLKRLLVLGVLIVVAAGAWSWLNRNPPSVTLNAATVAGNASTLSLSTHKCAAPDINGAVEGASACLRETFALLPSEFLAAGPGRTLHVSLDGASYNYALVRVSLATRHGCPHSHILRLDGGSTQGWATPTTPGRYTVRLVFDSAGDSGTTTTLFGLIVGKPTIARPTQFCAT